MSKKMMISHILILVLIIIGTGILVVSCKSRKEREAIVESHVVHPEWSKDAVIYEVNVRQYTPEGTFRAFEEHLPRLKDMGVDILWLMPIHPIGEKNRKGSLGSYYSVKDYTAVNPEFGNLQDLKDLVAKAHDLGMYVILDWVANHTAWDHKWVAENPGWYTRNLEGEMVSPYDWSDVADLNFKNDSMADAMIDAMKFWVREAGIDGYRCDVAGMVPVQFWNRARKELDEIKPVFMLAEAEQPNHHVNAFDMSYGWELHHIMNEIAQGKKNVKEIDRYFRKHDTLYPRDAYRMYFITNHDENSWNGTEYERMGPAVKAFAVLTYTLPGMPMIYSGQEDALNKRLRFFDKDTIHWGVFEHQDFYRQLGDLRKEYSALWSGEAGAIMKRIKTSDNESVFAFIRTQDDNGVLVITNLSDGVKQVSMKQSGDERVFIDYFTGEEFTLGPDTEVTLMPWEYKVLTINRD